MQSYVANRTGPPARPGSASSKRKAAGVNARVSTPTTRLQHDQAGQPSLSHRQDMQAPVPPTWSTHGPRRDSGETINGKNDRYGTDAGSSIDTTVNGPSDLLDRGQIVEQPQRHQANSRSSSSDPDDQSNSDGENEEDEEEYEEYDERSQLEEANNHIRVEAENVLAQHGFSHVDGNSYPSTTSGPPDDLSYQRDLGQPQPMDNIVHTGPSEPPNHVPAYPPGPAQPFKRADNPPSVISTMPGFNTIQKGMAIRETDQRVHENLRNREKSSQRVITAPAMPAHSTSKIVPQTSRAAANNRTTVPGAQIPQSFIRSAAGVLYPTTTKSMHVSSEAPTQPARASQPHTHARSYEEHIDRYQSVQENSTLESEGPVEDYDLPALFDMSYDQLRNEDFDHDPRGTNRVVSDDMQSRDLTERLVYAQKNFNSGDQDQFFRALPTREWEDAGDWFLDQFSKIIGRAKEARQNKRKIAREFEDKVEERYRHVAKRQRNVEAALDEMKEKGQGLIPKSPRASKEPVTQSSHS